MQAPTSRHRHRSLVAARAVEPIAPHNKTKDVVCRTLLLGEGDFTFALINKNRHPNQTIVATEFVSCWTNLPSGVWHKATANTRQLEKKGVTVLWGVDASQLDKLRDRLVDKDLDSIFDKVRFNFPFVRVPGDCIFATQGLIADLFAKVHTVLSPARGASDGHETEKISLMRWSWEGSSGGGGVCDGKVVFEVGGVASKTGDGMGLVELEGVGACIE